MALIDRECGKLRSFHVGACDGLPTLSLYCKGHLETETNFQTDENVIYHFIHDEFPHHDVVIRKDKGIRDTRTDTTSLSIQCGPRTIYSSTSASRVLVQRAKK